jgi:Ca-activated chloride channel family protein
VTALAKRYGITTPYTSYLIVPDVVMPVVNAPGGRPVSGFGIAGGGSGKAPPALTAAPGAEPETVAAFARRSQTKPGELAAKRGAYADKELGKEGGKAPGDYKGGAHRALDEARQKKDAYDRARDFLGRKEKDGVQTGKLGVDLSIQVQNLRQQKQLEQSAVRNACGRNCMELGGVWIDEGFTAKTPVLTVKAQSDAYFRILERHTKVKDVFRLGNHLVWITPSGTALVIDTAEGKEKLTDAQIDKLFVARK